MGRIGKAAGCCLLGLCLLLALLCAASFRLHAFLLDASFPLLAQTQDQASKPGNPPTAKSQIRVVTNEIIVPVTVTDASGEFVLDLAQKDFHVFDDGAEQTIDHWELGGDPLAVALVIETSSRLSGMIPVIHSMGSIFTETVMALDGEAAVITYDSTVDVRQPFTHEHNLVEKAIHEAQFEAPEMNLYDGMAKGVELLKSQASSYRKILLLVGESRDTDSATNLRRVVQAAEQANIEIYAVGPSSAAAEHRAGITDPLPIKLPHLPPIKSGPCAGQGGACGEDIGIVVFWMLERGENEIKNHQLAVAAESTGGVHYRAFRDSAMRSALDRIGSELHAQYILSYRPSSARSVGFHKINVTVSRDGVSVRARPGYYLAPEAQ